MATEHRDATLAAFRALTGLAVTSIARAGHERATMRYTFALADGAELRVDDRTLWSHTEFARESAVKLAHRVEPCKASTWRDAIEALVIHAVEVIETPGETLEDAVADWLRGYAGNASTDRDGAAAAGAPFIDEGDLHVRAVDLAKYIRREYTEQIRLADLRQALRDLGFTQRTINYSRRNGRGTVRSTVSYYRGELSAIYSQADEA